MLTHHELCFGCGRTNLFGLMAELEPDGSGGVTGRCFIKQDHQGDQPGYAHLGVVAAALIEAMSLAAGDRGRIERFEAEFARRAGVGTFLTIAANAGDGDATATATAEHEVVARASARYAPG